MNNNQANFDPMTGQSINQNISNTMNTVQPAQPAQPAQPTQQAIAPTPEIQPIQPTSTVDNNIITQQQMQYIPTAEQSTKDFISNTQANSAEQKEEKKKDGPNIGFIAILFIVIFASIFFLFPYLLKTLG